MLPRASILRLRSGRNLVALLLLAVAANATGSPGDIDGALEHIYREQEIQRDLTSTVVEKRTEGGFKIPAVFGWVVLGAAAVGAAFLALWLMAFDVHAAAAKRRRHKQAQPDDDSVDLETPTPGDWLGDADNLARQGRFAEAIHRLLLGVIGILYRSGRETSGARTAREIARTHAGREGARLRDLVQASELVHFGGRSGSREQYDRCRLDALEFGAAHPAPA